MSTETILCCTISTACIYLPSIHDSFGHIVTSLEVMKWCSKQLLYYNDINRLTGFVVLLFAITSTKGFTSFGSNYIVCKLSS